MTKRNMINNLIAAICITSAGSALSQANETVLFHDTFNRPGNNNLNANLPMGRRGSLQDTQWTEHNENNDKSLSFIRANRLILSQNNRTSAISVQHNFIDESIRKKGGFIVEIVLSEFNDLQPEMIRAGEDFDPANKYYGFGVGLSEAEVKEWRYFKLNNSFRGISADTGSCDFWIGLANRTSPELQIRRNGLTLETLPLPKCDGVLRATFVLVDGFMAGDQVEVYLTLDGQEIDIDTSSDKKYRLFKWEDSNSNYIALEARSSDGAQIDDFKISVPEKRLKAQTPSSSIETGSAKQQLATGLFVFSPILLLLFRRCE
jgi:hypothetical protein